MVTVRILLTASRYTKGLFADIGFGRADFSKVLPELLQAMTSLPKQVVKTASVKDIEREWNYDGDGRLVFVF